MSVRTWKRWERSKRAGFVAIFVRDLLTGRREHGGIVEEYSVVNGDIASAGRWHEADYPHGHVLWDKSGSVADVINELPDLPRHGESGAPHLTRRPGGGLWVPGD